MRRVLGGFLVVGGLVATTGLSALAVSASSSPEPAAQADHPVLSAEQTANAEEAVRDSPTLTSLAHGRSYVVESVGPWTTVGRLSGAAALIDFGQPTTLEGDFPVMDILNAVSEEERAQGKPDPKALDIRFGTRSQAATAREFSVLVDFDGVIKNVATAPPRAPKAAPGPTGETPPTNPPYPAAGEQ